MPAAGNPLALVGATVHASPADEPIRDGALLLRGGKIAALGSKGSIALPEGTQVLDCSGCTIAAGFWNSHVHFFERKWADAAAIPADELARQLRETFTRFGFTSVFDLSSAWENTRRIHDRVEAGEVPGPRIRSTGEGLVPPGAIPSDPVLGVMGVLPTPLPEITQASQAAAAARKLLDAGVDGIKLFASTPRGVPLVEGAIQAAVSEAHRSHRPVFVHPNSGADVLAALRAGADVIAHTTPRSGPWDEAILTAMTRSRAALTPTLAIWKQFLRHDRISTQERIVETALGQLRAWIAAGGTVVFGTDLGAVDPDPSDEYALMAQAGMSFREILASLTTAPADRFGDAARLGRIAPGLQADLVVLNGDPSTDLRALGDVRYTLLSGKIA
jgi:imidazolonepropionase-like amidohydrolase